jgi:polyhydroxyalkanoate synthase subunit PhaC
LVRDACVDDPARLSRVLAGLRAYQDHPATRALPPAPAIARIGTVTLRDYARPGSTGPVVVFVPSLINPPDVLDLAPHNSLLRWLAGEGLRPLLVDWGALDSGERSLDLAGIVAQRLVPLLHQAPAPFALAGYCLGGTIALAAAQLVPVTRLALIATPWHFSGFDPAQRDAATQLWTMARPVAAELGAMPMELVQPLFWNLDPGAPATKFARFADMPADSPEAAAFIAVEDWANDGPPLPLGVAATLFEDLFGSDTTGRGAWQVDGQRIDPASLDVPLLDIVSLRDRIVPAATSVGAGTRIALDLGHVGMIVGGRARAALWEPLAHWLRGDALPISPQRA